MSNSLNAHIDAEHGTSVGYNEITQYLLSNDCIVTYSMQCHFIININSHTVYVKYSNL